MSFTIIKNAGVPAHTSYKYPFGQMEVGDAFDFSADLVNKVSAAASHYSKRNGVKLMVRKQPSGDYRLYRAA